MESTLRITVEVAVAKVLLRLLLLLLLLLLMIMGVMLLLMAKLIIVAGSGGAIVHVMAHPGSFIRKRFLRLLISSSSPSCVLCTV